METRDDDLSITWNHERTRWEARTDDGRLVGRLDVVGHGDADRPEDLAHTIVEPAFEGRGIGARLVRAAFEDARKRGATVVPSCWFARAWVDRHAEYQDLVAG